MKTTVEALKDYYTEIGGTSTDVENVVTIPDMIEAITALGGGSSLPDVTAEDNGDVLTVVDGKWTKSAPQSPFKIVNASLSSNTITFENETQKSIYEAVDNGQFVIINIVTGRTFRCYVSAISSSAITFINVYRNGTTSTSYFDFTVTKSSDSDHTSINSGSSDDYSSGGPV